MVDQSTQRRLEEFIPVPKMEAISELNKEFAGAIGEVSQVYFEGVREFQSELLRFAAHRADDNSKGGRNFFQVHDLTELVELQQSWLQRFSDQYMGEAERLLHLMQRTAETAWSPLFTYERRLAKETERTLSTERNESCGQAKPARKKSAPRKT